MHDWFAILLLSLVLGVPTVIELVRRRERRRAFRSTGVVRLGDRELPMSTVKEIRVESFREYRGVAFVFVLRDDNEITVTNHTPDFVAALQELRIDQDRSFRLSMGRHDARVVVWRADS